MKGPRHVDRGTSEIKMRDYDLGHHCKSHTSFFVFTGLMIWATGFVTLYALA